MEKSAEISSYITGQINRKDNAMYIISNSDAESFDFQGATIDETRLLQLLRSYYNPMPVVNVSSSHKFSVFQIRESFITIDEASNHVSIEASSLEERINLVNLIKQSIKSG